ncbi:ABC transporter permease [Galbitalea soli]|uniref:ABC transporter permease n=1 Tax=Galbitalea soli TaxID=1268042 RepID=A0A7C9TR81_9MICO|nr:ABC transporter permease [Galbitalea soli]NEM91300.1 ABC transporter permease [Galbitalea soli]NYJ29989.1 simple sugar transport system permease protein [Galbitalea soli]
MTGSENTAPESRSARVLREIASGGVALTVLSVILAFVIGGILIAATDPTVQQTAGYFFARPTDMLSAVWQSVSGAYASLFRGGVYDFTAPDFQGGIVSLLSSLNYATPLIAAGLGIAIGFRTGVFNIGGQGQMLIGATAAGWVGFALPLPAGIHLIVAIIAGLLGGMVWAGIVGLLKARTGAHEVIVTIMMNYIALYLLQFLLHTPVLRAPGSQNPQTPAEKPTALLFSVFGPNYDLSFGFVLVVAATIGCWWLLSRSSLGFKLRAVGENPRAARVAGINVNRTIVYAMALSGLLVGLAGVYQVLGQNTTGFGSDIDAGIGFNAITVTLLGRSRPWGVFAAGIVFGILQAGSNTMQVAQGVDIDIVTVIQSIIVLFIAAPPLVRAIFRLPAPGSRPRAARSKKVAEAK